MWRKFSLVCVGVMTMFVIIIAVSVVHAQSPVTPNLDAYCKSLGYVGFKQDPTQPNNPYGKGCVKPDGTMVGIDMQAACRWQFGDVYPIAQYPDPMKPDWLCYPNNNTAPKPPPPMTPMSPTAVPQPQPSGGNSGGNPNPPPPNTGALHPDAQEPGGPGVKVPIICGYWGHGWGTNQNQANAYDWRCDDGFPLGPNEFTQACRDAWGSVYPYVTLADWRNKYGWQCSSQPGYIDPMPQGGNQPSSENQNAGCTGTFGIHVGVIVRVSPGDPNRLRESPSRSGRFIMNLPAGSTFPIIDGPVCADGILWWQITYEGVTGWTAEGLNGELFLERVGESSSSVSQSSGAGISTPITLPGGNTFSLQVEYDSNSCIIQNGAELTIMEILNLQYQLNGKSMDDKVAMVIAYVQPDAGIVEQIRHSVENAIASLSQSCNASNARYKIGDQLMDLSGPGNVVFGYVMGAWGWPLFVEDQIADRDQTIRDFSRKLSWHDEPDDICQRQVGRALTAGGRVDAINAGLLANEIGRSCSLNQ